jgi:hypothetical protein
MVFSEEKTDTPLPVFMGCRPTPQPKWRYGVAQQHVRMLQPLCDIVRQLLRCGLMGADLLRTFVSRSVQPLQRWEMIMWVFLGPSYPDRSFSAKPDDAKINAQIQGIIVHGADQDSGPSPTPLWEGVINPWVSLLKLIFIWLCRFPLL